MCHIATTLTIPLLAPSLIPIDLTAQKIKYICTPALNMNGTTPQPMPLILSRPAGSFDWAVSSLGIIAGRV